MFENSLPAPTPLFMLMSTQTQKTIPEKGHAEHALARPAIMLPVVSWLSELNIDMFKSNNYKQLWRQ